MLVNGASAGLDTVAVRLAEAFAAEVLALDGVGNRTLAEYLRAPAPGGALVAPGRRDVRRRNLAALREFIASGRVTPAVDRAHPLCETPAAGYARGRVTASAARRMPSVNSSAVAADSGSKSHWIIRPLSSAW